MIAGTSLSNLVAIAGKAIEVREAEIARMAEKAKLTGAYVAIKEILGVRHVERDTPEWSQITEATKLHYERLDRAKTVERNARRRLATAVDRYRKGGDA